MRILDGRNKLYQWDIGDFITDDEWQEGDKIHFDNGMSLIAPVVNAISKDGTVVAEVPNDMLQKDRDIRVYRYIVDGDSERTVDEQIFEVKQRPKPADYVYTPTEIWSYELLEKRIEALEKNGGGGSGQPGFSPIVSITPIENGHRVTITDIDGEHSFDVMNGEKGEQGERGEKGDQGAQGIQGEKGEKGEPYILTEEDKAIIVQDVLNALPNGDEVSY